MRLKRQYLDRCEYWSGRSQSRLRNLLPNGNQLVQLILDGLDHSKMKVPRLSSLTSKDFSSFNRPNLDLTCCLCHGWGVYLFTSMPFMPKDSNLMSDAMLCVLNSLARNGLDLRSVDLRLQSDNTVRECKNNTLLRVAGGLVASHHLKRVQLQNLVSGHSHEDVDGFFGIVSSHIQSCTHLPTAQSFVEMFERFLSNQSIRAHDPLREVYLVSAVRDWQLGALPGMFLFLACGFGLVQTGVVW